MIKMPKKGEYFRFKNYKIKSTLMIYADFGSILEPEDIEKKNLDGSYIIKDQKHIPCSYGYKGMCWW